MLLSQFSIIDRILKHLEMKEQDWTGSKSINRRTFMWQTGALSSASVIGLSGFTAKKKYKMGLQLFTVREPMAQDPKATLKKIASLGYEDLETYGFDGDQLMFYGMKAADF